jgi:hypothetical protein
MWINPKAHWKFERIMKRAELLLDTFTKFRFMTEDAIKAQKLSQQQIAATSASPPTTPAPTAGGDNPTQQRN